MSVGEAIAAVTTPAELYELLDPEVMWYSVDVNSNYTCNSKEDAIACIERNLAGRSDGSWELVRECDDFVVLKPHLRDPDVEFEPHLLLRVRDGLIVEMRDFGSREDALRYAGIV